MSNNNFDFDFDDVSADNMAKGIKVAIFVLFFVMSAVTTFQFFFNYAPGLGAFAGEDIGPYLSGIMGVLLLDAASLVWLYVRSSLCTTQTQMNMALVAAITTITGALLTSSVYVLLTSRLDVGAASVNGQLTDFGMALNVIGNVIMIAALMINFGGMFLFEAKDIKIQQAIGRTTLLAQDKQQKLRIALQRQFLTAQAETSRIKDKLPTVAHNLGTAQADQYIDALQSGSHHVPRPLPPGQPLRANNAPRQGNGVPDYQDTITVPPPQRTRVASEGSQPPNFQQRAHGPE